MTQIFKKKKKKKKKKKQLQEAEKILMNNYCLFMYINQLININ